MLLQKKIPHFLYSCSAFQNEFVHWKKGQRCQKTDDNVLETYAFRSENITEVYAALDRCEKYCSFNYNCWGCSINRENNDQFSAISDCNGYEIWTGLIKGDISQKPGRNNIYIVFG